MPDVPTLILSGGVDMRTPLEGAQALAAQVPHPQIVRLAGSGHDVGDSDTSGCVYTAEVHFFADRPVGSPCAGKTVALPLAQVPPRRLADVGALPGVPGDRGRVVRAATETITDALTTDNESYYAGFSAAGGGGLRGGAFQVFPADTGEGLSLNHLSYVPGVALTGALGAEDRLVAGFVSIRAPGGLSGHLHYAGNRVTGRLGGRLVHASLRVLARTEVPSGASTRQVSRFRLP